MDTADTKEIQSQNSMYMSHYVRCRGNKANWFLASNIAHRTDFDKSTIYMESQEGSEKNEVESVTLEKAQSRCNTVGSNRSTLKFEPNQSSAEKNEAEPNNNNLSLDVPQANIMEEECLVVMSDICKNTTKTNHTDFDHKFDQNKPDVNNSAITTIREYSKLEELNLMMSTEQPYIAICNTELPAKLSSTIEPATADPDLKNAQETTYQIKLISKYNLIQHF